MAGKLYVTGDIHGIDEIFKRFSIDNFMEGHYLTKDDCVVILGDLDLFWNEYDKEQEIAIFDRFPWTTAFIDGNHENFDYLNSLPTYKWCGGYIHKLSDSLIHLIRGYRYDFYTPFVAIGGASSINKEERQKNNTWSPDEIWSKKDVDRIAERFYEIQCGFSNFLILSHTAPTHIIERCNINQEFKDFCLHDPVSIGLEKLFPFDDEKFINQNKKIKWFFGHIHTEQSIQDRNINFESLYETIKQVKVIDMY